MKIEIDREWYCIEYLVEGEKEYSDEIEVYQIALEELSYYRKSHDPKAKLFYNWESSLEIK